MELIIVDEEPDVVSEEAIKKAEDRLKKERKYIVSELTLCSYCSLRAIRKRAQLSGKKVILRPSSFGGTDVFVIPKDINKETVMSWKDCDACSYYEGRTMSTYPIEFSDLEKENKSLRAENEKLREALEAFNWAFEKGSILTKDLGSEMLIGEAIEKAREALKESK